MSTIIILFCTHIQRPLWRHYYQNTDALIFVIDSNDRERLPECKDELWRFMQEDELKDCVLLVMANKQDLPNAMTSQEITDKLQLNSITDRKWCKYSKNTALFHSEAGKWLAVLKIRCLLIFLCRYPGYMCHLGGRSLRCSRLAPVNPHAKGNQESSH
jgi:hypothetical protein